MFECNRLLPLTLCLLAALPAEAADAQESPWWDVALSGGYESLSEPVGDWKDVTLRVERGTPERTAFYGEVTQSERFDLSDTEARLGTSFRLGQWWAVNVEGSASPTSRVVPDFGGLFDLYRDIGGGVQLSAGGRFRRYDTGDVLIGVGRAEYYVGVYRLGYSLSVGDVDGERAPAHNASVSRYFGDRSSINLSAGIGKSVERIGPDRLLITEIVSGALYGTYWTTDRLALTFGASLLDQTEIFDRVGGRLGVIARF